MKSERKPAIVFPTMSPPPPLALTPTMRRQLEQLQQQQRRQQRRGDRSAPLPLEQLALRQVILCVKVGAIPVALLSRQLSAPLTVKVLMSIPLNGRSIEGFMRLAFECEDLEAQERGLRFVRESFKGLKASLQDARLEAMLGTERFLEMEEEQTRLDAGSQKLRLKGKVLEREEGKKSHSIAFPLVSA